MSLLSHDCVLLIGSVIVICGPRWHTLLLDMTSARALIDIVFVMILHFEYGVDADDYSVFDGSVNFYCDFDVDFLSAVDVTADGDRLVRSIC